MSEHKPTMEYRLVLTHPEWPHATHTKWQTSLDFDRAKAKAKAMGISCTVESRTIDEPKP